MVSTHKMGITGITGISGISGITRFSKIQNLAVYRATYAPPPALAIKLILRHSAHGFVEQECLMQFSNSENI